MNRTMIFWATLMILVLFSAYAEEQFDPEDDFIFEIIDGGNAVKITGHVGTNTEVRIPQRIQGLPVTHIGWEAFRSNRLASIAIGNRITHIGDWAFQDNYLTNIVIPDNVTYIGDFAFLNNQLASVAIGNGVTHIGDGAFRGSRWENGEWLDGRGNLTSVTIGNGVTHIGTGAFMDNQLTDIAISRSVTHIGNSAFTNNQLTNIVIPDSVTVIGSDTFRNNQIVTAIIPSNINIGSMAFFRNPLTSITLGSNIELPRGIVFDNQLQNLLRSTNFRAGTYIRNNGRWQFSFPELATASGNRLANTVWENSEVNITIRFGETSFSFTSVDRWGHSSSLAGFYAINGDLVTLNFGAGAVRTLGAEEIMGAITGNLMTLSVFGVFARIQ